MAQDINGSSGLFSSWSIAGPLGHQDIVLGRTCLCYLPPFSPVSACGYIGSCSPWRSSQSAKGVAVSTNTRLCQGGLHPMKSACKTVCWLLCSLLVWDLDFRPPAAPSPRCWELRPAGGTFFTPRTRRLTASSPVLCPPPPHLRGVLPPRCFQPQSPAGCFIRFHLHEASLMPDCPCFV